MLDAVSAAMISSRVRMIGTELSGLNDSNLRLILCRIIEYSDVFICCSGGIGRVSVFIVSFQCEKVEHPRA